MAKQGLHGQTEGKEGDVQLVEAETCTLGRIQRRCLNMREWDQENQSAGGTELGKGCKK